MKVNNISYQCTRSTYKTDNNLKTNIISIDQRSFGRFSMPLFKKINNSSRMKSKGK